MARVAIAYCHCDNVPWADNEGSVRRFCGAGSKWEIAVLLWRWANMTEP